MDTFLFYDLETSGRDPRWHRIMQFAGIRTDVNFEPIGAALRFDVRLDPEVLPEPEACLITGLTPQRVASGIDEGQLFRHLAAEFGRPRTCVAGYNNLRFDDEFVRFGFWRNLRDPYAREWQGRNSRWDLIDLARMAAALRPEGMVWPRVEGRISFRLEDLAAVNAIEQTRAHDATADVEATLGLARALRRAQPSLFEYHLSLRSKQRVAEIVGRPLGKPLLHVSPRYGQSSQGVAIVAPIAMHPVNRNAVILVDLGCDHERLIGLDEQTLADSLFQSAAERGDEARLPLQQIALNKLPAVAPIGVLKEADQARLGLDLEAAQDRLDKLRGAAGLAERVRNAHAPRDQGMPEDVDAALYGGFLPDEDRRVLNELADATAEELIHAPALGDERARELLFRQLARRHPDSLDESAKARWQAHMLDRLRLGRKGLDSVETTRARLVELAARGADPAIIQDLQNWWQHCVDVAGLKA